MINIFNGICHGKDLWLFKRCIFQLLEFKMNLSKVNNTKMEFPDFKLLHIYVKKLHKSKIFQVLISLLLQLLVKGGREAGNFFELVG